MVAPRAYFVSPGLLLALLASTGTIVGGAPRALAGSSALGFLVLEKYRPGEQLLKRNPKPIEELGADSRQRRLKESLDRS